MRTAAFLIAVLLLGGHAPPLPRVAAAPKVVVSAAAKAKAVPLDVSGDTVVIVKTLPCTVTASAGADLYFWTVPDGVKATAADNVLTVTSAPNGTYTVAVTTVTVLIDFDKKTKQIVKDTGSVGLNVGLPAPPVPPQPPEPPVPPVPPTPGPVKDVKVLVVYDPAKAYPTAQQLILQGKDFRDYTKTRGTVDGGNPFGPVRIWPKDTDVSGAPEPWKSLFSGRKSDTGIVVQADGKVAADEALPADVKAAIDLINKAAPKGGR